MAIPKNYECIYNIDLNQTNFQHDESHELTLPSIETSKITKPNFQNKDPFQNDITQSRFSNISKKTGNSIMTLRSINNEDFQIGQDTDFLQLDLRLPDEYESFHIKDSINFPAYLIPREHFISQIYEFKNKKNKLIIIYHNIEKSGVEFAQQMVEKNFENLLYLNGGITQFADKYPHLIEGNSILLKNKKDGAFTDQMIKKSKIQKKTIFVYRQKLPHEFLKNKNNNYIKNDNFGNDKLPSIHFSNNKLNKEYIFSKDSRFLNRNQFTSEKKNKIQSERKRQAPGSNYKFSKDGSNPNFNNNNNFELTEYTEKPSNLLMNRYDETAKYVERKWMPRIMRPITPKPNNKYNQL